MNLNLTKKLNSILSPTFKITLSTILFSSSVSAVPQTNIRETCRKRVSGMYLSTYDKNERAQRLLKLTSDREIALKKELVKAEKKKKTTEVAANKTKFDIDLNNKVDQATTMVKRYKSALVDQKKLKQASKIDFKSTEIELRSLKERISKVFNFVKAQNSPGYKFNIEYKNKCTKFRYVCPLPKRSRELLVKIFIDNNAPESCLKYSGHFK